VKMPQESIIYLTVCLSGIIIFVFLGLLPAERMLVGLDAKIAESRLRLEEQKTLMPIYLTLKQRVHKNVNKVLPFPNKKELPREQMAVLNSTVNQIARQANVEVVSLAPPLNALASSSKYLTIETSLKGNFTSFRKFLIGLGALAYVEHFEEIYIMENPESMEMKLKFSIARS